jgi:alkylation response protein AidB-like acyl-CoA dehydrogenase
MDFSFTAEQHDLRRAMRDVAADRCPPARLREVIATDDGYDAELWALLRDDLGLVGIAVSESHGGTGGSFVDAAVVLEESGRALFPVPLLTGIVAATVIDRGDVSVSAQLLPAIAGGSRTASLVVAPQVRSDGDVLQGTARHVIDGDRADVLVIASPGGLWAIDSTSPGVEVLGAPSIDLVRRQATVSLDGVTAARLGDADASASAVDLLRVALAIEAIGGARHCLESTVDYLKTREQFGRPIGSFQALQHRVADLAVDLEAAASTAYYAAWVAADTPTELPVVAPLAKAVCAEAAYRVAADTIQLHGGIGFTWEHDAHLYFKRATATQLLLGDAHVQRGLVAQRSGLLRAGGDGARD